MKCIACFGKGVVVLALLVSALRHVAAEEEVVELSPQVVTASPFVRKVEELVAPADALSGRDLDRNRSASLGATLDGEAGVNSTYFGPGAGRPIIRGFDGDRVRILNQGTDSFDVSQTSPDHGVSIEPLFADDIEVVRGPASLLYGNAAIGGVVNVIGKELPRERALQPLAGELEAGYGSAADESSAGMALQGGQEDFAWSFGYLKRSAGDVEIPGFAESVYQRAAEEESEEHEEDEEEAFGVLENSFVDTESGYVGMAWFREMGSFAGAFSQYSTNYGVPGHGHHHEEETEEEHEEEAEHEEEDAVSIDLDQSRLSLRGELLSPTEFFESAEIAFSWGEYRHAEMEGDEVGTVFDREGYELRVTGVHRPLGNLTGAFGMQVNDDSFEARGEEAFIPGNDSGQIGLFVVERLNRDWGAWEFGGRIGTVEVDPHGNELSKRSFTTVNASAGLVRSVAEGAVVAANLSYAERAPNASALFAFGPHVATRSFEIGSADLDKERSGNVDLSYRLVTGRLTGSVSVFYSEFSDYVYMRALGESEIESQYGSLDTDGLAVLVATPTDARFYGYEIDLRYHIVDETDRAMHFDLLVDQVRATNRSLGTNLPRVPTRRIGGRYEYRVGPWTIGLEGRHNETVTHLAPNELPTDSYFLWGMDILYRIQLEDSKEMEFFAVGSNLGDEEARPHTSYLKDVAPMPGRNLRAGVRFRF